MLITMEYEIKSQTHGGDKKKEFLYERKKFKKGIVWPLSYIYFCYSYHMKKNTFYKLFAVMNISLENKFHPSGKSKKSGKKVPRYHIWLKIKLSAAIHIFAGGDLYYIILSYVIGYSLVYRSVWGGVDCVNSNKSLGLNFLFMKSSLHFRKGLRWWPALYLNMWLVPLTECCFELLSQQRRIQRRKDGEKNYKCSRKDTSGINLQAICDNKHRFYG